MIFELDLHETVGEEVRRMLIEQVDHAVSCVRRRDAETAIHETRKAGKRARAVIRLARPGLSGAQAKALSARFRDMARPLSPLRDADVEAKTLAMLGATIQGRGADGPGAVEAQRLLDDAVSALLQARDAVDAVRWEVLQRRDLVAGYRRSYSSARQHMSRALHSPDPEAWHDWRKAVKANYYHQQLLAGVWPDVLRPMVQRADLLQEALGDLNDILVLRANLAQKPSELAKLDARMDSHAALLRGRAESLAAMLYAVPPRAQAEWLSSLWSAAIRATP